MNQFMSSIVLYIYSNVIIFVSSRQLIKEQLIKILSKMSNKERRKTKFNNSWKESFGWISAVRGDEFSASCNICNKKFAIHHGGISDIKQHSNTDKHIKKVNQ